MGKKLIQGENKRKLKSSHMNVWELCHCLMLALDSPLGFEGSGKGERNRKEAQMGVGRYCIISA